MPTTPYCMHIPLVFIVELVGNKFLVYCTRDSLSVGIIVNFLNQACRWVLLLIFSTKDGL